jgi:23S rRNA (uracil1939-C5)-methyltransferase
MKHIVKIEKIIAGGKGLARTAAGQVIMSGFVLPDETVELVEVKKKSGYIEGEPVKIHAPSAARIEPLCPHYLECGGCDLQHGDYAEQLRIKKAVVEEAMQRAGVPLPVAGVRDTVPSPAQWGYRHRLRLKINPSGQLGFFKKQSNDFVPVNSCPVATEGINSALAELVETGALRELPGICKEAELLQSPGGGQITLVLPLTGKQKIPAAAIQAVADCAQVDHIGCTSRKGFRYISAKPKSEPLSQNISLPGRHCTLSWSGGCFSQVNPGQNEQLIQYVCAVAGNLQGKIVLDLYCGMGNFSIPLGLSGGTVTGIESNRESVEWAKRNADAAGITARFFAADVHDSLRQLVDERQRADLILLDPPRIGIGKAAALLPELQPERIIYISCDPATLARDLRSLCDKGHRLSALTPLDMFPQTSHIESVALLENKG